MTSLRWMLVFVVLVGCKGKADSSVRQPKQSENNAGDASRVEVNQENAQPFVHPENADPEDELLMGSIQPDYTKAVLTAASQSISPTRVLDRWPSEHLVDKSLIRIRDTTVESLNYVNGNSEWTSQSPAKMKLKWLGQHNGTLLFADIRSSEVQNEDEAVPLIGIRRLRLRDGVWLKPFVIPLNDVERAAVHTVSSVLGTADGMMVLSVTEDQLGFFAKRLSYRVTQFAEESADVLWSNAYESAGNVPDPGAFVFGTLGPARDSAAIQGLTPIGSHVLICGGPLEDLMAITPSDGTTAWKVPRLWEIERGFIGPSVWKHFLSRYGVEEHDLELAELTLEELRAKNKQENGSFAAEDYFMKLKEWVKEFREQTAHRHGSITAGPVVVIGADEEHGTRIFVATAQSTHREWPGYLSECVCYELDDGGRVIGIVTLPRFVNGSLFSVVDNSVVWQCEQNGIARLFPSPDQGTSDQIIDVEWRVNRERKDDENKAWFQNGSWSDQIARVGNSIIRIQTGGFVETSESHEYQFRFEVIDLLTNRQQVLQLRVPYRGKFLMPMTNYSTSMDDEGDISWVSYSYLPLSIAGLEVRGDRFVVVIKNENKRHSLEFDLKAIVADQ